MDEFKKKLAANLHDFTCQELTELADEIRQFLILQISKTGGHIGANLGTIELTLALHSVFNSPQEPLLFDTGHTGYTHKLLTDRIHLFDSLNSYGGMNRFLTPKESEHDLIEASHAGTALSLGLGLAKARYLEGNEAPVVSIIGDAALAEGSSMEALNHAAVENTNLIIVLNDNGYAISPGFGAFFEAFKDQPARARSIFEGMGYQYLGPVDGHNIDETRKLLKLAKNSAKTPIVHLKTIKGKGWYPANNNPYRHHYSPPYDNRTGDPVGTGVQKNNTYPDIVGRLVQKTMEENERIVCLTPSTLYATGLSSVFEKFPSRCIDPGMQEQHTLTLAVGLALSGMLPIVAYQSTFLQRAFDQLIHDVCFTNLPMIILSTRSGFSGYDNPTHHGIYDISYMRAIPNLTIYYPKDKNELEAMFNNIVADPRGPVVIMMPYGSVEDFGAVSDENILKPEEVFVGTDILFITVGNKFKAAKKAALSLGAGLVNIRQLKPLPEVELVKVVQKYKKVVTIEEGILDGGLGSAVAAMLFDNKLKVSLLRLGLPSAFIEPGSNEELCKLYGLDSNGILDSIESFWS